MANKLFNSMLGTGAVETVLYRADIGRTSGGEVDGWTDTTAAGITVSGGSPTTVNSGTVTKLGLYSPATTTAYRNQQVRVGGSITITCPVTAGVPTTFRTHHWSDGGSFSSSCGMACTADGDSVFSVATMNFELPAARIFEFTLTPAGSTVELVFSQLSVGVTVSGIEVIQNYRTPTPHSVLVGHGDSIIWGSDATDQYHDNAMFQLWKLLPQDWDNQSPDFTVSSNYGVPGASFTNGSGSPYDLKAGATALIDPLYNASAPHNILFIAAGVNDYFNGRTAAQIKADIQAYCEARQAVGWKVIVGSLPILSLSYPSYPAGYAAARLDINAWIDANWSNWADYYLDLSGDAYFGDAGDPDDTTYIADGLHYNTAGYLRWAGYMLTAVETLAGI